MRQYLQCRAVANGPVGPAMAGPIIEPAIFFFLIFLLYFLAGIIIEPGFFSILFLKQRRHSGQNVHSDDSILGRFRPSHAIASRQSSSFDGWERPPGARVRWPLQRLSMRRRDSHSGRYICVLQIEPTSEQVSQTVLHVSQTVLRWSWQHEWTENVCC